MHVDVRFFASLTDRTGCARDRVELPDDADVAALWRALVSRYPPLADAGFRPLVACDLDYADWEAPLRGVREVAFLPPFSGG